MRAPNRNYLWTRLFVEEWARAGLTDVCIAPGSRSTPLTIAFAEHEAIRVHSLIDERGAAFTALGLALATRRPVALVCSSGTATANFYPAVIEAYESGVPLLILTADRPAELRESGANQTIDQVRMFGTHVLWSVDVAPPEAKPAALTLRALRTLTNRTYALANGDLEARRGPVHLNFPFRKPLEPIEVADDDTDDTIAPPRADRQPYTRFARPVITPTQDTFDEVEAMLRGAQRGWIVAGVRADIYPPALSRLSRITGLPMLADPLSGARFSGTPDRIIAGYDTFLRAIRAWPTPEIILHFGAMPVSQAVEDALNAAPDAYRIWISQDGRWRDATHRANTVLQADGLTVVNELIARLEGSSKKFSRDHAWLARFRAAETTTWQTLRHEVTAGEWFDGAAVMALGDVLPDGAALVVANSLPIRHVDQFMEPSDRRFTLYCNRGASGIDGTLSTAIGVAAAQPDRPTVLLIGDLAFYHDLNALHALQRTGARLIIVLLNNDGGAIFNRLPIADFDPPFTDLFRTPTGLDFEPLIRAFGLHYTRADSVEAFAAAFASASAAAGSTVIEVRTDGTHDLERRNTIIARVGEAIARI